MYHLFTSFHYVNAMDKCKHWIQIQVNILTPYNRKWWRNSTSLKIKYSGNSTSLKIKYSGKRMFVLLLKLMNWFWDKLSSSVQIQSKQWYKQNLILFTWLKWSFNWLVMDISQKREVNTRIFRQDIIFEN